MAHLPSALAFLLLVGCVAAHRLQGVNPFSNVDGLCKLATGGKGICRQSNECEPGETLHKTFGHSIWACPFFGQRSCCVRAFADQENCGRGVPVRRILNGFDTPICSFTSVASIRGRMVQSAAVLNQETTQHACGAVIIDRFWVLTHALCCYITNKPLSEVHNEYVVVVGEHNTSRLDPDPRDPTRNNEQFIPVEECIIHPDYVDINTFSDVNLMNNAQRNGAGLALMKLAEPINNYCASTACLPNAPALKFNSCDTFRECVIVGWGFETDNFNATDGTLKAGQVKLYKGDVCDLLQNSVYTSGLERFNVSACQVSDTGNDGCLFDQGGPVLCYDSERMSVQGIIPINFCVNGQPNPYVIDVAAYNDWIVQTVIDNS